MKITSFSPMIIAKDPHAMEETFIQLGFAPTHTKADVEGMNVTSIRMKDENGFHVDVVETEVPRDILMIRVNVDNFDEALELLESKGFKKLSGKIERSSSSIACSMVAPSGLMIDLCQHL